MLRLYVPYLYFKTQKKTIRAITELKLDSHIEIYDYISP